jgi:predicted Zn-dependent peptidase
MQHRTILHAFLGAFLVLLPLSARAADVEIKFEKYKLPNGLTVILSEDHRLPQVAVNIWYHVGAANQTPGKSGFAHLFEHMMFSGSKHVQPSPFKVLEAVGTTAGAMANGTTNFDRTNYFEVMHASELATALWIESDRMAFLLDTLDEQKLKVQRDVVSNERRQSYENRPYGITYLKTCDLLYPAPHPYYECVIGSIPEIQAASMDDLKAFFRRYYAPNNASLVIAGNFDPQTAKALVEKYFAAIPSGPPITRPDAAPARIDKVIAETVEDKVAEVPRLDLVYNGLKLFTDDEPAGDVLLDALGTGRASRLYKTLVFEKQVASDVSAGNQTLGLGGFISIDATAKAGVDVASLKPLIDAEIERMKRDGPTDEEVDRAKRNIIARMLRAAERLGGFGGRADILNMYETYLGDPGFLSKDIARYRAVTKDGVKAFAQKYLPSDKRLELTTVPVPKATAAN